MSQSKSTNATSIASTHNERIIAGVRGTTSTVPVTVPGSSTAREYKTGSTATGPSHWEATSKLTSAERKEYEKTQAAYVRAMNFHGEQGSHWK